MRFIVELSTLAGLWFWGDTRPVAGAGPLATVFGIVIVGAALWWLLAAAWAAYRLERPLRLAFQAGMFGVGVLASGSRPAATDRRAGRQFDRRPLGPLASRDGDGTGPTAAAGG